MALLCAPARLCSRSWREPGPAYCRSGGSRRASVAGFRAGDPGLSRIQPLVVGPERGELDPTRHSFVANHPAGFRRGLHLVGDRHVVQLLGVFGGGAQRVVVEEYALCRSRSLTVSDAASWLSSPNFGALSAYCSVPLAASFPATSVAS